MHHKRVGFAGKSEVVNQVSRAPGKRTLTESAAAAASPQAWPELVATLQMPEAVAGSAASVRSPAPRAAAADQVIHRSELEADAGGGACLDPDAVRADLQRISRLADGVRAALEVAALSPAMGLERYPDDLRELARQTEVLRPAVEQCTLPEVGAELGELLRDLQDRLLACFQQLSALHADRTLQAWSDPEATGEHAEQRNQWRSDASLGVTGEVDWCGAFAGAQLRAAGLAPEHHMAFNHVDNVAGFFTYATNQLPRVLTRIRPFGAGPAEGRELQGYHGERGSVRDWKRGAEVGDDLRAGDIVTVDWADDGIADHIVIVASYTPASGSSGAVLVTIDGNSYGVKKPGVAAPAFDGSDEPTTYDEDANGANARAVSTSRWETEPGATPGEGLGPTFDRGGMNLPAGYRDFTIYGRGRPSLVDFEAGHVFPEREAADIAMPESILDPEANPLQRKEAGPIAAADPQEAFAGAAAGSGGEIPYRAEMEQRFGSDFSSVQSFAGRDLSALGAHAATRGEQVVFASAAPDRQTVAHELTHVLQTRQGRGSAAPVSDPGDASEREARQVASSFAGGQPLSAGAAPSAAVHRQEEGEAPAPLYPPTADGSQQGNRVDWSGTNGIVGDSRIPVGGGSPGSVREIYELYLLRYLWDELPMHVTVFQFTYHPLPSETLSSLEGREARHQAVEELCGFLTGIQQSLIESGDATGAEVLRVAMFRANQHAIADALQVETAQRYQSTTAGDTWCNIWAFDLVTAMGGYLPRIWYTNEQDAFIVHGEAYDAGRTLQVRANDLYDWMMEWGVTDFGWEQLTVGVSEAQAEANAGHLVIILGRTVEDDPGKAGHVGPGHVSVVMAESQALGRTRPDQRTETEGGAYVPLQSQAGADNFASNGRGVDAATVGETGRRPWWLDPEFQRDPEQTDGQGRTANHGYFVYRGGAGMGDHSVRRPEEMGLVAPATGGE